MVRLTERYAVFVTANLDTVLGKAVTILRAFRPDDNVLPLAELVRRTELHKATVHRLAGELVANRLLDRVDGGYRLSGGLFELGMRASVERSLLEMAMPFLQDLYERTHETVHLGVRDELDVVYVVKLGGHRQAKSPSRTGGRNPWYCTAIGKALLAHADGELVHEALSMPKVRRTPHTIVAPGILRTQLERVVETGVAFERRNRRWASHAWLHRCSGSTTRSLRQSASPAPLVDSLPKPTSRRCARQRKAAQHRRAT